MTDWLFWAGGGLDQAQQIAIEVVQPETHWAVWVLPGVVVPIVLFLLAKWRGR